MKIYSVLFVLFSIMVLSTNIYAEDYLGNLEFEINDDGTVTISGETDYPEFQMGETQKLTNKAKELWIFDLNTPVFENYYYSIILPKDIQINYINSPNKIRITNRGEQINIVSSGEKESITITIQYKKIDKFKESFNYIWVGILIGIIFAMVGGLFLIGYKKKIIKKEEPPVNDVLNDELNDRQKDIVDILIRKKMVTQHYLLEELKIPKSSLSRNLKSLEDKEIIEVKRFGITNKIVLKK